MKTILLIAACALCVSAGCATITRSETTPISFEAHDATVEAVCDFFNKRAKYIETSS